MSSAIRPSEAQRESALSCLVRLDDLARDATARGDVVAVAHGPLPHSLGVGAVGGGGRGGRGTCTATADLAAVLDIGGERLPESGCVLGCQVDLELPTVQSEGDGLVRGLAVRVVRELGHD